MTFLKNARWWVSALVLLSAPLLAQTEDGYTVVAAMGPNVVFENPGDGSISMGDQFMVVREDDGDETVLAIGIVDKFQGKYSRVRVIELVSNEPLRKGDILIPREAGSGPTAAQNMLPEDVQDLLSASSNIKAPAAYRTSSVAAIPDNALIAAAFTGMGQSNFKGAELYAREDVYLPSQSFFSPLGLQLVYRMNRLELGAEASYAVAPFQFKETDAGSGEEVYTDELEQMYFGTIVRFNFYSTESINLFARTGAGAYLGDLIRNYNQDYSGADENTPASEAVSNIKAGFGFNIGGGLSYRNWFVESMFHGVNRTHEVATLDANNEIATEDVSFNASHWTLHVGLQFAL